MKLMTSKGVASPLPIPNAITVVVTTKLNEACCSGRGGGRARGARRGTKCVSVCVSVQRERGTRCAFSATAAVMREADRSM